MLGRIVTIAILTLTFSVPVLADETASPGINKREHRQKERIKAKEEVMKSDGTLTKGERKELHQDLNKASEHIAEQKHDAQTR